MAEGLDLSEIVRRTVQVNARLYKGWLDLSLEYFRGISEIFGGPMAPAPAEATAAMDTTAGVLVMEGEEGTTVRGAFLVTNDLDRSVTCELVATEFAEPGGTRVRAAASFEPPSLELAPGEQRVVQATIVIDSKLAPGAGYAGEFAIKGMDGFAVPVVLRRRHRIDESPIDREPTVETIPAPEKRRARQKK